MEEDRGTNIKIRGVPISFPFKPYKVQLKYISSLLESLHTTGDALLESPTGTGKTLCLLTGALSWQQAYDEAVKYIKAASSNAKGAEPTQSSGSTPASGPSGQASIPNNLRPVRMPDPRSVQGQLPQVQRVTQMLEVCPDLSRLAESPTLLTKRAAGTGQVGEDISKSFGRDSPVIIYASRTHSQLKQVIKELGRVRLPRAATMGILGSRAHLCINERLRESELPLDIGCRGLIQAHKCRFHTDVDFDRQCEAFLSYMGDDGRYDMEDLCRFGQAKSVCPHILSRRLAARSPDIVFMPYNYLLVPQIRQNVKVAVSGAIGIIDEAHNIDSMASDAFSDFLTTDRLDTATEGFNELIDSIKDAQEGEEAAKSGSTTSPMGEGVNPAITAEDLKCLREMIQTLNDTLQETSLKITENGRSVDSGLAKKMADAVPVRTEEAVKYLGDHTTDQDRTRGVSKEEIVFRGVLDRLDRAIMTFQNIKARRLQALDKVARFIALLVKADRDGTIRKMRLHLAPHRPGPGPPSGFILNVWSMAPDLGVESLFADGLRTMVLTSGTLSPLDALASELGRRFPVRLENVHVIPDSSLWAGVVSRGPQGALLSSAFANRGNAVYQADLGGSVAAIVGLISGREGPGGGVLVFFPSYSTLETMRKAWMASGQFDRITQVAPVFVEPRSQKELDDMLKEYTRAVAPGRPGAVLLAVCRGRCSEGIDFADRLARAVLIVGIPFPSFKDPRIEMKREYQDQQARETNGVALTGQRWYSLSGGRSVNQAIGRVVRHVGDHGAIILLDDRFAKDNNKNMISGWVRRLMTAHPTQYQAMESLGRWWTEMATRPPPAVEKKKRTWTRPRRAIVPEVPEIEAPGGNEVEIAREAEARSRAQPAPKRVIKKAARSSIRAPQPKAVVVLTAIGQAIPSPEYTALKGALSGMLAARKAVKEGAPGSDERLAAADGRLVDIAARILCQPARRKLAVQFKALACSTGFGARLDQMDAEMGLTKG